MSRRAWLVTGTVAGIGVAVAAGRAARRARRALGRVHVPSLTGVGGSVRDGVGARWGALRSWTGEVRTLAAAREAELRAVYGPDVPLRPPSGIPFTPRPRNRPGTVTGLPGGENGTPLTEADLAAVRALHAADPDRGMPVAASPDLSAPVAVDADQGAPVAAGRPDAAFDPAGRTGSAVPAGDARATGPAAR